SARPTGRTPSGSGSETLFGGGRRKGSIRRDAAAGGPVAQGRHLLGADDRERTRRAERDQDAGLVQREARAPRLVERGDDGLLDLGAREPSGGVGEAREVLSGGRPSVESLAGRLDSVDPRRVVSLCPSITETLVAIGGLSRLVAATRYSVRPQGLLWGLPRSGGTKNPDVARSKDLAPDLVF